LTDERDSMNEKYHYIERETLIDLEYSSHLVERENFRMSRWTRRRVGSTWISGPLDHWTCGSKPGETTLCPENPRGCVDCITVGTVPTGMNAPPYDKHNKCI
jgi:hypothetical protein